MVSPDEISPVVKNKKGKVISRAQKLLVINLFKKTVEKSSSPMSIYQISHAVAEETGIGVRKVRDILKEYQKTHSVVSPKRKRKRNCTKFKNLDEMEKSAIRAKVHDFFRNKELPTINKILSAVNDDPDLPNLSRTTLYRILKKLHFKFSKRGRNCLLMDKDEIVCWRRHYLREIKKHRAAGKKIYYLDETWLNAGHTVSKAWHDNSVKSSKEAFLKGLTTGIPHTPGKGKRLIITHIGNEDGFVYGGMFVFESNKTNEYHEEMNSAVFEDWFRDVLPELEPGCVIVMDNAPYHSRQEEKIPNTSNNKADIIAWLLSKNVQADMSYLKVELLDMVKKVKAQPVYVVDKMARECGRTVLRLPPYHCVLNPIELVWADVKGYVARRNKSYTLKEAKELLLDGLQQMSSDKWKKCVDHVIKTVEPDFWKVDELMEAECEPMEFVLDSDEEDDLWKY